MGYDLVTAVRLERDPSRNTTRLATVCAVDGRELLRLTYGHAATIWRINKGWRRRKPDSLPGFVLDTERGYWARNEEAIEDDPEDPMSASKQRVVPYVEDRRNCLLIEPVEPLSVAQMASLQPALKNAIQVRFQLEDSELAAEPLPSPDERKLILLYEAAEGGAGVLRQLLDDPVALAEVAGLALRLCHFDPKTGDDMRRAPHAREDCEAACYDCLMSYGNQPDHQLLDRLQVRDLLLQLTGSVVKASPVGLPRAEHVARLKTLCDSDLERAWLDFVDQRNLRLPDAAQRAIPACHTVADFFYSDSHTVVFIDGPVHDHADIAAKDRHIDTCLWDLGIAVIRFRYDADWTIVAAQNSDVFGPLQV
jgi:very-short-patch-repair endonuclease